MVKNILVKNDENFNLSIMLVAVTALGGILTVGIFALYAYFRKIIMIEKDDNQILDIEIITKLKRRRKSVEVSEAFNNIYLFLKEKNAKVIGFIGDKYCHNKEKLIVELSKNVINNKNILIINYNNDKNSILNKFILKNKFYKNKLPLKFSDNIDKQEEVENSIELLTNDNIDILNILTSKIIMELGYEIENIELLKELFEEYDYIFINLDNKITNTGTKVFSELCDTVLILNKNYKSKEDNLKEIKRFCREKKFENIGVLFI